MSEFRVPDMSCGHCENAITKALKKAAPEVIVKIDLGQKLVDVSNLADETVESLLKDLGYTPQKVK